MKYAREILVVKLTFEVISDDRFDGSKKELIDMTEKIDAALSKLEGITVQKGILRELRFPASENEPSHITYRRRYFVTKSACNPTWNDVYAAVNRVYSPKYEFQN